MTVTYFYTSFSKLAVPDYPAYDETDNRTWGPHAGETQVWCPDLEWQDSGYWPSECVWIVPGTVTE